jgi:hypothetical protein
MSASSIDKAQQLLAARLAAAPAPQRAAKAKTVKGQRNAATRAVKATEIESIYQECWQAPAPFSTWSFYQSGTTYKTVERALDAGRSDLVVAYKRYVNHTFETPFNAPAFEKIAKREAYLERQGKQDLGLLGYSAVDRVQLASWYAFVRQIERWLTQTGASEETADVIGKALRDFRSDDELRDDARLGEAARYEYGTDGRLRRKSQTKHVNDARKFLAARRLFNLYPVSEYAQAWVPSVGAVYREVHAVTREGLRQFRNTLEGLTSEGFITDASQYSASVRQGEAGSVKVGDLVTSMSVPSVEDELFEYTVVAEQELQRTATLNALRTEVTSMLPAEIEAFTFLELLTEGMSIIELREVFGAKTERAFAALLRDAQYLVSTK